MTIINCISNCIYQKDGKCNLNKTVIQACTPQKQCAYFKSAKDIKKEGE